MAPFWRSIHRVLNFSVKVKEPLKFSVCSRCVQFHYRDISWLIASSWFSNVTLQNKRGPRFSSGSLGWLCLSTVNLIRFDGSSRQGCTICLRFPLQDQSYITYPLKPRDFIVETSDDVMFPYVFCVAHPLKLISQIQNHQASTPPATQSPRCHRFGYAGDWFALTKLPQHNGEFCMFVMM